MTKKFNWKLHELKIGFTFSRFYRALDLNSVYRVIRGYRYEEMTNFDIKEVINEQEGKKFETVFKRFLKKGDSFIDCGTNVGRYSILASKVVGKKGHVYSFEPTPSTFKQLLENIKGNHATNVTPYDCAVGDKKGKLFLNVSSVQSGENSFVTKYYIKERKAIPVVRLDDVFGSKKGKIKMIKVDIEGYEKNALLGAKQLIKTSRPVIIFEFNFSLLYQMDKDYNQVFDLLGSFGYGEFREIDGWKRVTSYRDLSVPCTDVIALPGGRS